MCPNHLDRQFRVDAPGKVWVSDITYIHTTHGFIYLTTVMDLYDRKIVGWSMSNNLTTKDTAARAYQMAIGRRRPTQGMIFPSDRGVQYASEEFRNTLANNVVQSMSRKGNCWDNAVAESFFKSLKCELIYGNRLLPAAQIELEIFEYIEIWYNKARRHSALKNMTIDEFWKLNNCVALNFLCRFSLEVQCFILHFYSKAIKCNLQQTHCKSICLPHCSIKGNRQSVFAKNDAKNF